MKNGVIYFFLALLLSSCGDMTEEYWLEEDGSGRAEFTMDLEPIIDFMEMMMPDSIVGEGLDTRPQEEIDSTIRLSDFLRDSIIEKFEAELKQIDINVHGIAPKSLKITMGIDFNSVEQYRETIDKLNQIKESIKDSTHAKTKRVIANLASYADKELIWKPGLFIRKGVTLEEMKAEAGEDINFDSPEEKELMMEIMGESRLITIVHLPKKVCKVKPKNSLKERSKIVWSMSMTDMFEMGIPDVEVKYKK